MIGKRIRAIREAKGMSQAELAETVEMAQDKVCKIEAGKRRVTAAELPLFAKALGCTSSDELLVQDDGQAPTGTDG